MSVYLTPGIYLRPQPAERKDLRLVRTDVAGFVGFAERGPLPAPGTVLGSKVKAEDLAIRLTSWKEFTIRFGGFIPYGSLAYAVRAFFDNGGTTCYVMRVAGISEPAALAAAGNRNALLDGPRGASFVLPAAAPLVAARLTQSRVKGDSKLILNANHGLKENDLIAIASEGVTEFSMVISSDETSVTLGRKSNAAHNEGAAVYKYPSAVALEAVSAGNWGSRIRVDITPLEETPEVEEFSMRVTVEPGFYVPETRQQEIYKRLSLNESNERFYAVNVINQNSQLVRIKVFQPHLFFGDSSASRLMAGPAKFGAVYLQGGRDGLSGVKPLDFTGGPDQFFGLRILEEIDEIAILCAPDVVFKAPQSIPPPPPPVLHPCEPPPEEIKLDSVAEDPTAIPRNFEEPDVFNIYQTLLDQCERLRDRVAILDPPAQKKAKEVVAWRAGFNSRFGALYYPWLKVPAAPGTNGKSRLVPPSGHVAGIYARTDNEFGVHRPPANAPLEFINDVGDEITAIQQEELNPFDVNAIRSFAGRGIRVWGARSLASKNDSDWRFIHARRLMSMIEESVFKSMQWAVFEPNDFSLRRTLVHSLSVFLEQIWREGGLKGVLPEEAFYVKCDETNNPTSVVDAGQIVCQVGIAVAAPMEFIVFEIRRGPSGSQIVEGEE